MDNLTHTLTALLLARGGLGRAAPYATPALLVAANAPDIDFLYLLGGATTYLEHNRGWTHSLAGAAALGAGVAAVFWWRARTRHATPHLLRNLLLVSLVGALSHSLLDWMNPYGTQLLWPLTRTGYALDWFPLIDPLLIILLLAGLALPALFGLIGEEIGARRKKGGVSWGPWAALAACALLAAGRATLHAEAVAQLESRLYATRSPLRVAAFPTPVNPLRWDGVVETATTFETLEVAHNGRERGDEALVTFYKPAASPMLEAALATRTAQVFLAWARFPLAEVNRTPGGWRIHLRDLRYRADAPHLRQMGVWVELDTELRVVRETLRMGTSQPPA